MGDLRGGASVQFELYLVRGAFANGEHRVRHSAHASRPSFAQGRGFGGIGILARNKQPVDRDIGPPNYWASFFPSCCRVSHAKLEL